MSSLRFARSAFRARPSALRVPMFQQRRGYAEAVSDKIKLSLALPHQVTPSHYSLPSTYQLVILTLSFFVSRLSTSRPACTLPSIFVAGESALINITKTSLQVNLPAASGEMGVLANHVPSIEQLKPGLIEVIEEGGASKQFFCMMTAYALALGLVVAVTDEKCLSVWWICCRSAGFSAEC